MKIVIFGATGGTGRELVGQGLALGHEVSAFARRPEKLGALVGRVRVIRGDALDPAAVGSVVAGQEAVLSALGATGKSPIDLCSRATAHIIEAMRARGVRRLVCESAYGAGESRAWSLYSRWLRAVIRARVEDKDRMEDEVAQSGLDWVIVRPPLLTNGPRRGRYREALEMRLGWAPTVSRADTAHFMLRMLTEEDYLRSAVTIAY